MIIRPAVEADLEGVAEAHVESWRDAYMGLVPDWYLASLSAEQRHVSWRQTFDEAGPRSGLLVLEASGPAQTEPVIAGFAHFCESRDEDADVRHVGEVTAIYLRKRFWRQGEGAALLARTTDSLLAAGFAEVTLWVLEGNHRARRFYEAQGWKPDGAQKTDTRPGFQLQELRYRRSFPPSPPAGSSRRDL